MNTEDKESLLARFLDYLSHNGVRLARTENGQLAPITSGALTYIHDFLREDKER